MGRGEEREREGGGCGGGGCGVNESLEGRRNEGEEGARTGGSEGGFFLFHLYSSSSSILLSLSPVRSEGEREGTSRDGGRESTTTASVVTVSGLGVDGRGRGR